MNSKFCFKTNLLNILYVYNDIQLTVWSIDKWYFIINGIDKGIASKTHYFYYQCRYWHKTCLSNSF